MEEEWCIEIDRHTSFHLDKWRVMYKYNIIFYATHVPFISLIFNHNIFNALNLLIKNARESHVEFFVRFRVLFGGRCLVFDSH